jgi:hypothetical protein
MFLFACTFHRPWANDVQPAISHPGSLGGKSRISMPVRGVQSTGQPVEVSGTAVEVSATSLETSSRHAEAVIWAASLAAGHWHPEFNELPQSGKFCSVIAALSQICVRGGFTLNKVLHALALMPPQGWGGRMRSMPRWQVVQATPVEIGESTRTLYLKKRMLIPETR